MGVPGLFSYLRKYNKSNDNLSTIKSKLPNPGEPIHLYLDFNGAIYQAIKPEIRTDDTLILHICEYLDNIVGIFDTQNYRPETDTFDEPTCGVAKLFIAIDGVPPRAKMEQQRQRRFHSVCRRNRTAAIDSRFGTEFDKSSQNTHIDTNMITPGTVFMDKLRKALQVHLQGENSKYRQMDVYFSDWSNPGEGEHKIYEHLRENPPPETGVKTVIYGLDGDLIMLSLASQVPNLFLIREAYEYGQYAFEHAGYPYLYMDINCLKVALVRECTKKRLSPIDSMTTAEVARFIDDYVVLMMMLGNDFMPKIPWIGIRNNGAESLLAAYFAAQNGVDTSDNPWLFDRETGKLNMLLLRDVFNNLARQENRMIVEFMEDRQRRHIPIPKDATERERQQILLDFLPMQSLSIEAEIRPQAPKWRARYYAVCHGMEATDTNIDRVCDAYIRTLIWNANYYIGRLLSWDWYYPYDYPPTLADIAKHIDEMKTHSHITWKATHPVDVYTLLLTVLPTYSAGLMPSTVKDKITEGRMSVYFPESYELNLAFRTKYYECTPKIPKININATETLVKDCVLTKAEKERASVNPVFIVKRSAVQQPVT